MFAHAFSSSGWFHPTYFDWDRINQHEDFIFITDTKLGDVETIKSVKKYAWLIESPAITTNAYQFVQSNATKFDKIFTHSSELLKLPNSYLVPIGGCFLDNADISSEYEKTKLISMIYSSKQFTEGHKLRFEVANRFGHLMDAMGSGKTGVALPKKISSCDVYAFSIAIENCRRDYYFTEKIIDCFLTGTVPIYWGCPSIGKFFNTDGFFIFNTIDELYDIIRDQNKLIEFYTERGNIILENYNTAMKYKIADDYLYLNYIKN